MAEFINCDFCGNPFINGTGHLCYCKKCDSEGLPCKHPMCKPCYEEGKRIGKVKDTPHNMIKYNISTLEEMR